MNEGVKIIAERLLADPSQLQEGSLRSVWIRLAELVEENYRDMFTNEEINHIRQAKMDAMRLEFSALVLDCIEDREDAHIAIPRSKNQMKLEQAEQKRRMDEMDMNRYMRSQTATGTSGLGGMSGLGNITGLGGF